MKYSQENSLLTEKNNVGYLEKGLDKTMPCYQFEYYPVRNMKTYTNFNQGGMVRWKQNCI